MEQLISAGNVEDVFRLLADKGWGGPDVPPNDPEALLAAETEKTWNLIGELTGELDAFNVFRYANDFHNLKAAIKLVYSANDEKDTSRYFIDSGTVEIEKIKKAAEDHDFSRLPADMAQAGAQAYEALAHTGSGQACDMVIDRAALIAIDKAGKKADSDVLRRYAELTVDSANIKAAVRAAVMNRPLDFIERAVAPAGTLDTKALITAAASGLDSIYQYLENTAYFGAIDEIKTSLAAFERWCDNQMMEMIRPQRNNYFTIEPLAAFILARENEISMVRLILSAKINKLSNDVLRERLREMYV